MVKPVPIRESYPQFLRENEVVSQINKSSMRSPVLKIVSKFYRKKLEKIIIQNGRILDKSAKYDLIRKNIYYVGDQDMLNFVLRTQSS